MKSYKFYRVIGGMSLIFIWFFRGMIFGFLEIEFSEPEYLDAFRYFWSLLIPISIVLLAYDDIKENKKKYISVFSIWIILLFGFVYLTNGLSTICGYIVEKSNYVNKNSNIKLYYRDLNCGAWDSDPPNPILIEITPINKYLNRVKVYDESKLDLSVWKK